MADLGPEDVDAGAIAGEILPPFSCRQCVIN